MLPFRMIKIAVMSCFILFIMMLFVTFPSKGFDAAVRGVAIWWDILFPALFPFFVISEVMLGFGIVHFFGTLLDPMMRPVFRVPGIGGFVMAMGFASGYPVGARLTSQLWEQRLVNRDEGERLVAFTSTSDPIFLIGAVSVGFFQDVSLAAILAISHYGAAVIVGLIMRFHGKKRVSAQAIEKSNAGIVERALKAMHEARIHDGRPIGLLLENAVQSSIKLIFVIGGLVVFFSVVLEVLTAANIMQFFYTFVSTILHLFGISNALSEAVVNGFFEVTLGAKSAGGSGLDVSLVSKVAIAAFVLSWSGLSVHAQIVSLLSNTNLRYLPFVIARVIHGLLSATIVYLVWNTINPHRETIATLLPAIHPTALPGDTIQWLLPTSGVMFTAALLAIITLYILYSLLKSILFLTRKFTRDWV